MAQKYYKKRKRKSTPSEELTESLTGLLGLLGIAAYFSVPPEHRILLVVGIAIGMATLIGLTLLLVRNRRQQETARLQALQIIDIAKMSGEDFERYLVRILESRGYANVSLTEKFDYGVDIIAEKDGIRWGIQAKRHRNPVNTHAISQVLSGLSKYHCTRAMVITNSTYTWRARESAERNNCVLVGKDELAAWIVTFQQGTA